MEVNKLKQILFDSSMQQRDLTTELKPLNHHGNNHNGRKPGSKNKMTLAKLAVEINEIKMTVAKLAIIVENGFNQVNTRIDNLVSKNNLKE